MTTAIGYRELHIMWNSLLCLNVCCDKPKLTRSNVCTVTKTTTKHLKNLLQRLCYLRLICIVDSCCTKCIVDCRRLKVKGDLAYSHHKWNSISFPVLNNLELLYLNAFFSCSSSLLLSCCVCGCNLLILQLPARRAHR